ncbi:hypothetical protein ABZ805_18235 [Saccharopolyspora sp. NPDC047091]|uniref:hypothetical protein n=1 Tax=Saccharopolyspora sp. NPDC047091 TaxID=3155924 RepID=UPI0033ED149A
MKTTRAERLRILGAVFGHVVGWALFALGVAAWCVVFPVTVRGFGGSEIERNLATLWVSMYAVLAGAGTAVLIGVLTWRRVLARIVLGVWAVLLCAAVLGVAFGGR